MAGPQHRSFRHDDGDGFEATVIHRHRLIDQRAHDIEDGGAHDRERRIEIAGQLVRRSGEVDGGAARLRIDGDSDLDRCAIIHRIGEAAVGKAADQAADGGFGLILDMGHIGGDAVHAIIVAYP